MQALLQRPNTGRYPELTNHVRDFSKLRDTVDHETAGEAAALRDNDAAREAIRQWVQMPDPDATASSHPCSATAGP